MFIVVFHIADLFSVSYCTVYSVQCTDPPAKSGSFEALSTNIKQKTRNIWYCVSVVFLRTGVSLSSSSFKGSLVVPHLRVLCFVSSSAASVFSLYSSFIIPGSLPVPNLRELCFFCRLPQNRFPLSLPLPLPWSLLVPNLRVLRLFHQTPAQ